MLTIAPRFRGGPAGAVAADPNPVLFSAVLRPNRSATAGGLAIAIALLAGTGIAVGIAFLAVGAWPVTGFLGLDVLLVALALRWNYRTRDARETIDLTRSQLLVRSEDAEGRAREFAWPPAWVQIRLADAEREDGELRVRSHGRTQVIGNFLSPSEKRELAHALKRALARINGPAALAN